MIIVDFSHLSSRNLYVAISQVKPKKVNGKYVTDEFIPFYYHLMLQSLRHVHDKFSKTYGEIILALDDRNYWRRDIYPEYKASRKKNRDKSDIDFETFYAKQEEFIGVLSECFPYKVFRYPRAEADDIIGVLSKYYGDKEKIVVVTSDKDMKQVMEYGVKIYDPIKGEFMKLDVPVKEFKIQHVLCGDDGDNIPHIKRGTQFTDTFIGYLRNNGIYVTDPVEFNKLSIAEKLYSEFDIKKKNKKGEEIDELDIFKATPFGPAGAKKFAQDLKENLKQNPIYMQNFKRNSQLIMFDFIPQEIQEGIKENFKVLEVKYNPDCVMRFLSENQLLEQLKNISDFHMAGITAKKKHEEKEHPNEWV